MDAKEILEIIRLKDAEIKTQEAELEAAKSARSSYWTNLRKAIKSGDSTGDPICDLVVSTNSSFDADLEVRYRTLEERLKGFAGELALFTFMTKRVTMSRRGGPEPEGSWDRYENAWGVACGVLKDEKLQTTESTIVLPIEAYAISGYGWNALLEFRLDTNPLVSRSLSSHRLDGYFDVTGEKYGDGGGLKIQIHIGDANVRRWFDNEKQPEAFRKCCDLLGKLVLEPTEK